MRLTRIHAQQLTGDADRWLEELNDALIRWEISTPDRVAMFLAQCAHESGGFRHLVESLHYSAAMLLKLWPHRFTADEAVSMAYNEEAIAERAYGGRMGNGPEGSGDGFRYRGRGVIQLTGRDNYRRCGQALGTDLETTPEAVERPKWAAQSAGWFWATNGCNALADAGDYEAITRRINGGLNGWDDRLHWLERVRGIIGAPVAVQPAAPIEDRGTEYTPPVGGTSEDKHMGSFELVSLLASVFSPLIRAKVEKAVGTEVGKPLVDNLLGMATQLTGKADPLEAVAVARQNPAVVAKLETASEDWFKQAAPFLDKIASYDRENRAASDESFDKAAKRLDSPDGWNLRWQQVTFTQKFLGYSAISIAALIAAMTGSLALIPDAAQSAVLGLIGQLVIALVTTIGLLGATFRDQNGFSFGGTASGNAAEMAKDELIARRPTAGVAK